MFQKGLCSRVDLYLERSVKGEMFSEHLQLWHMTCPKVGTAIEAGIGISFMVLSPCEHVRLFFFFSSTQNSLLSEVKR